MLFRALVHQRQPLQTRPEDYQPDVHVFFEATRPEKAKSDVQLMLGFCWGVPHTDIRVEELHSEDDLRRRSCGGELDGDIALFEHGGFHGPTYCLMDRTLLMVRPTSMPRLLHAQCLASMRASRLGAQQVISQRPQRRAADGNHA